MSNNGLFETTCGCGCGAKVYTYAKDRMGTLPRVYVDKTHEANDKYKKRFDIRFVK